ncbi:hypothetical protein GCM10008090_03070 [Arenicella chitinivorans]|uniref:Pili assembly chaperone N-terminal domain-containing protein n=1 Tax=Arenicella chitinivorans TaxID=1329800 RepID=A0A918RIB0_9GAMM|nr:fimbria/pilus periplasmic chaperone [Arenicella chitinivorans]GGZ98090.1 hypothetical protein GCM10008090_03070 [Arenicella chitinivorans]
MKTLCQLMHLVRIIGGTVLVTTSLTVNAASFNVLPVRIYMPAERPVASIKVENKEQTAVTVQSETVLWAQQDNRQILTPTNELIVSPAIFELPPGGSQVVRVAVRGDTPINQQRTFRLFLSEVPAIEKQSANATGVTVALRLSLPIFVTPKESKAVFSWRLARRCDDATKQDLLVQNLGDQHAMMLKMTLRGETQLEQIYHPRYVLPDSRAFWPLTTDISKLPQTLWLDYETLSGATDSAELHVDENKCWQPETVTARPEVSVGG